MTFRNVNSIFPGSDQCLAQNIYASFTQESAQIAQVGRFVAEHVVVTKKSTQYPHFGGEYRGTDGSDTHCKASSYQMTTQHESITFHELGMDPRPTHSNTEV